MAAIVLLAAATSGLRAEDYPTRPVTIIAPFAAGGPADITARIVADIFSRHLGQRFLVENVGGTIGTLRAAFVPRGTPQPIVDKLAKALDEGLSEAAVQQRLAELGSDIIEPERRGPTPLSDLIRSETARLMPILNAVKEK